MLACEDLFEWILPVSDIYDEKIKRPKFNIQLYSTGESKNTDGITIDFRLFDRWDETNLSDKISVRSDYVNSERLPQPDNKKNDIKKENRDNYINNSIPRLPALDPYRDISDALKKFTLQLFGFNSFKDGQFEIINHILTAKRTLGLLPTGGGKSLCFHLTASLVEGCCLVIAPIIALMNDQEEELKQMGFTGRVVSLSSQLKPWERDYHQNKINEGKVQFAFVSPERCQQPEFRDLLQNIEIGSVVVDEVHCLSEWGHDFRLSYLCLPQTLKRLFSDKPITCLTATASINVLRDIQNEFELENEDIVYRMNIIRDELGFRVLNPAERPELGFEVFDLDIEKKDALFQLLASLINEKNWINSKSAGIIFTPTIDNQKGCYFIQKELDRKFPNIKTGLFCGRKPDGFKVVDSAARSKFGSQPADFTGLKTYYQNEFKK